MARYMFTNALLLLIFGLASLILVAGSALPSEHVVERIMLAKRDVWSPKIHSPKAGSVWRVGEVVEVLWDAKHPPKHVTNSRGMVVLRTPNGFVQGPGGLNEPLASNFSLYDGRVSVDVPRVPGRDDYQVVLFGDSGNDSPRITIASSMIAPAILN